MKTISKAKLMALLAILVTMVAFAVPAASAAAAPRSRVPAAAATPCSNTSFQNDGFNRCTSNSPSGSWSGLTCAMNTNVNANGNSPFNVYAAGNGCPVRVWLHQNKDWATAGGWTFCISPVNFTGSFWATIPTQYQHPLNIYFSSNQAGC